VERGVKCTPEVSATSISSVSFCPLHGNCRVAEYRVHQLLVDEGIDYSLGMLFICLYGVSRQLGIWERYPESPGFDRMRFAYPQPRPSQLVAAFAQPLPLTYPTQLLLAHILELPRYLFRISTPKSDGTTDEIWVKSKDARYNRDNNDVDIFSQGEQEVGCMLDRHLRWKGLPEDADNLVSWTSSLLFALQ